jgi:hypothetical protein
VPETLVRFIFGRVYELHTIGYLKPKIEKDNNV